MPKKKKKGPAPFSPPKKKPPFWKRGSVPAIWKWASIALAVLLCVQGGFLTYYKENHHEKSELLLVQTQRTAAYEEKAAQLEQQLEDERDYAGLSVEMDFSKNIKLCDYTALDFSDCGEEGSEAYQKAMSKVCEKSELIDYPENMYEYFEDTLDDNFRMQYDEYGVTTLAAFLERSGYDATAYIEQSILMEYAVYAIAAKEGLSVTQADYDELLYSAGYDSMDEMMEALGLELFEIDSKLLYDKVAAALLTK